MIIVLLLCMSIGYSYLLTTLNIEGTSNIKANTWDVHWENVQISGGNIPMSQVIIPPHILSDTTKVESSIVLKNPGEYGEYTVDAKNAGSLDAMVSIIETKFYEENGVTQISLPNYLEYSLTYLNGDEIEPNHLLAANSSETYRVSLKYKDDLDESQLPTTDKTIVMKQSITYVQADENAIPPRIIRYSFTDNKFPLRTPVSSINALYSTPEEVMAETGYPAFLKHVIKQGMMTTSEVGFKYNGNIYYLKGGIDESNLEEKPFYNENKESLSNIFGSINCEDYTTLFVCQIDDFIVDTSILGSVSASVRNEYVGYSGCIISVDDNGFYAYCGPFAS